MRKDSGFTLWEVMTVVAIIGILAAIGTPPFLRWRADAKLRGAVINLRGDVQYTRSRAIRESSTVSMSFPSNIRYIVFLDNGAVPSNGTREADERIVKDIELPSGVTIITNTMNPTMFDGRGIPDNLGDVTVVMENSRGEQRTLTMNRVGRMTSN